MEFGGQVIDFVELASPGQLSSFDGAVEVGGSWGQDQELDLSLLAGGFEFGHEFAAAVDLDALDGERGLLEQLVEEFRGTGGGGAAVDMAYRPARDGAGSGEVFELLAGLVGDAQGIDLDPFSRSLGLGVAMGQVLGMDTSSVAGPAMASAQAVKGFDPAPLDQVGEDASDGRFRGGKAFPVQQDGQGRLAPGRESSSQLFDSLDQLR